MRFLASFSRCHRWSGCWRRGWLALVVAGLVGCASAPRPPVADGVRAGGGRAEEPLAAGLDDVAIHAIGLVGTPYRWGGNTPEGGFDCSGLIGYVYHLTAGVRTPRSVKDIQSWGQEIAPDQVRVGDVVLFGSGNQATHAGIVVSRQRFVHAPSTGGVVRLDHLGDAYWRQRFMGYRRATG